ncbi:MAG: hypothetical protein GKR89_35950 [Candidatus Latescibacteria bacterium]|nr:hypothetical protein [Candidatus Latescibacterota bacterium]
MLSDKQIRQFATDGYLVVPGALPLVMVEAARRAVNHSIGHVGLGGEDLQRHRAGFHCAELLDAPVITDLYNKSPVMDLAQELMGVGNVKPVKRAKAYPRFPLAPGQERRGLGGHLDGIGNGSNGQAKGAYNRNFSAFAVIYLADVAGERSGNFTVWPQSHRVFEAHFKEVGHQILAQGRPQVDLPEEPVMVTARAGDLVLAHHALMHGACPNESPDVRLAAIARLSHVDVEELGPDAYLDIWREWPGVRRVLEAEPV